MDPFGRIDTTLLFPELLDRLQEVFKETDKLGETYVCTEGFRSMSRQLQLEVQGEVTGVKVTAAGPGHSAHQFGLAVDVARFQHGKYLTQPIDYVGVGHAAEGLGLIWGGRWKSIDADHIQWPGFVHAMELDPLFAIYNARPLNSGSHWLDEVWDHVVAHSPTMKHQKLNLSKETPT